MSCGDQEARERLLAAFLERYVEDGALGERHGLRHYLDCFPDDPEAVAAQFLALREAEETGPEVHDLSLTTTTGGLPETVGPYRLEHEIGRGGQSSVWLAVDTRLERRVALKLLSSSGPGAEREIQRFRREATILSQLNHPSICVVHEAGLDQGVAYIAMQLVEGRSLADVIAASLAGADPANEAHRVTLTRAEAAVPVTPGAGAGGRSSDALWLQDGLEFFEAVARALHVAHEAGVIHRDIKPGNIMVSEEGKPVILDFGLARSSDENLSTLTHTGDAFGTPTFMSPEQVRGDFRHLDRRTDVFSLGAALYQFLSGRFPFQAPTRQALFQVILSEEPTALRRLNPRLPPELEIVVATAMEKDLTRRYQSAAALADDLRRVRERQPIEAKAISRWLRLRRVVQRNPGLSSGVIIAFLALSIGLGLALVYARETREARDVARDRAQEARQSEASAQLHLVRWRRLADGRELDSLLRRFQDLYPPTGARIPDIESWIVEAQRLLDRRGGHERDLAALRAEALPPDEADAAQDAAVVATLREKIEWEREMIAYHEQDIEKHRAQQKRMESELEAMENSGRTSEARLRRLENRLDDVVRFIEEIGPVKIANAKSMIASLEKDVAETRSRRFATGEAAFQHERLEELIRRLRRLDAAGRSRAGLPGARHLLQRARRAAGIEASEEFAAAWRRMQEDVGREDSPYRGLKVEVVPGLFPLGRDRDSGFWELWCIGTGRRPEWKGESGGVGQVVLDEASSEEGLVMVLLPAGRFLMGTPGTGNQAGGGTISPTQVVTERPQHEVSLAAFFISKYEVTLGQWMREFGRPPGTDVIGTISGENHITARHAAASISHAMAVDACRRWGLELPTEARWEYACRAGTTTDYFCGDTVASLEGYANVYDQAILGHSGGGQGPAAGFDDGYVTTAPVGSFRPNAFGLYDTHGNVYEVCREPPLLYSDFPPRAGDGRRGPPVPGMANAFMHRGGGFESNHTALRSSARQDFPRDLKVIFIGLRPVRSLAP